MKTFDTLNIEVKTVEGGSIVSAQLALEGTPVETVQRIVAGKPGLPITGSRIRKAVRQLVEAAFPRMKLVASEAAGQLPLPGITE